MVQWRPTPGLLALIEPVEGDAARDCLTGVVLPDTDRVLIDLGASPKPRGDRTEVVASFFTDDALYRMTATAVVVDTTASLVQLEVTGVERVQRRSSRRIRASYPVSLSSFDGPGEFVSVTGETVDLAPGGCRVSTNRPFPAGVDPTVSIRMPEGAPLVALAHILEARVRPERCEYRLAFADMADEDLARLKSLIGERG